MMLMYMGLSLLFSLLMLVLVLISVAFLTLFERKLLGYIQFRKGPNKVGIMGLLQPISDAVKLFLKEFLFLKKYNYYFFIFSPMYGFMLSMLGWMLLVPNLYNSFQLVYSILLMLSMMMISLYSTLFSGWSSNSNYSMLGSIRSVSQSISYEVSFALMLIILMFFIESFNLKDFIFLQGLSFKLIFCVFPLFMLFYISIVAELNRSPFDLMEGESELVSGFNTEYMSSVFAFIFLAEYSYIIFYNYIMIIMFLGFDYSFIFFLLFMNSLIIYLRGICPRIRYDQLMYFCWLVILPFILMYYYNILLGKFMYMYTSVDVIDMLGLSLFLIRYILMILFLLVYNFFMSFIDSFCMMFV